MLRIALAGSQDVGKTTLAKIVSANFNLAGTVVDYVSEYAREYIGKTGEIKTLGEQMFIYLKQLDKEERANPNAELVFTDSPIFLGYIYSSLLRNSDSKKDWEMFQEIYKVCTESLDRYQIVFLLHPFRKPLDDGIRKLNLIEGNDKIATLIENFLQLNNKPYYDIIDIKVEDRVKSISDIINKELGKTPFTK